MTPSLNIFDIQEPIIAYWVACPLCGEKIFLPLQSPLGKFEYPERPPMGSLKADFLCLGCGNGFSDPAPHFGPIPAHSLRSSSLVEVPYLYGHGNSEVRKVIYIGESSLVRRDNALQDVRAFLDQNFGAETGIPQSYPWEPKM
jgi:hypothetical protein